MMLPLSMLPRQANQCRYVDHAAAAVEANISVADSNNGQRSSRTVSTYRVAVGDALFTTAVRRSGAASSLRGDAHAQPPACSRQ